LSSREKEDKWGKEMSHNQVMGYDHAQPCIA
jgi:hypothetical protein